MFRKNLPCCKRNLYTRVADPVQDQHLPLHSSNVGTINLTALKLRLNDRCRERFELLWQLLHTPGTSLEPSPSTLTSIDADKLVADENATLVVDNSESRGWCRPFCIIEEKPTGPRRRFILWPKQQNDAVYAQGFTSGVDLEHISRYLPAIADEIGVTRDLKVGFWQIELPQSIRSALRFKDDKGRVFEPTRLPMGHCLAVDIMQMVTHVIANDPLVCKPAFAHKGPLPDVWVDGLRFTGSTQAVQAAITAADTTARELGATWKEAPQPSTTYNFIGVDWDHNSHSVITAKKTLQKINITSQMQAHTIEQVIGRLIFAAAVSGIAIVQFYFALKWTRRIINAMNRAVLAPTDNVTMAPSVVKELIRWSSLVRSPRIINNTTRDTTTHMTLFTDASNAGWGATLFNNSTAEMLSSGAKWSASDATRDIAEKELLAVGHGVDAFQAKLRHATSVALRVDNTSTQHALLRGTCRADALAQHLSIVTKKIQSLTNVNVGYVKSCENLADGPSRGLPVLQSAVPTIQGKQVPYANSNQRRGASLTCDGVRVGVEPSGV
jgi:hypothetical protein